MAKKKTLELPTTPGASLKHNPFAALAGAAPVPSAPSTAPVSAPSPAEDSAAPTRPVRGRGRVVLRRETKGRGGKPVIVISGLSALAGFDAAAIAELAQQLKQQLGCGGTVESRGEQREVLLQGDRAAKVAEILRERGFRVDGVTS